MTQANQLTQDQIDHIFFRWYSGEKVDALLVEMNIERIPSASFSKHFPPLICNLSCPHCSSEMHAFRSDAKTYKKSQQLYDLDTAHCRACGHDSKKMNCNCCGCVLKREELQNDAIERENIRRLEREISLERLYEKLEAFDFENIDLLGLIYLYALCYQSTCEDISLISPISQSDSPLTPTLEWDKECIGLLGEHICPYSMDSNLLLIDENGSAEWYVRHVYYRLKLENKIESNFPENLLSFIKNKIRSSSSLENSDLANLVERLFVSECINYLEFMREKYNLPHETGPKTAALFKKLVQNWRVDQIYTIIWVCCKDALAFQAEYKVNKKYVSNTIIGKIDKYVDKVLYNSWTIKSYYRDTAKEQSVLSYVVLNKILELGGYGIEYNLQDITTKLKHLSDLDKEKNIEPLAVGEKL